MSETDSAPAAGNAPPGAAPADSAFTRFNTLMRRIMALFWLFAALLGLVVVQQLWLQRQAAAAAAQSGEVLRNITLLRLRMSDLLSSMILFEQAQNPDLMESQVACGALCEHLPRLARQVSDTPEMQETIRRAMVWDARLAASLREAVVAARHAAPAEEVKELLAQARNVELPQLRRKIDEIAFSEVRIFSQRQARTAQLTRHIVLALALIALGGIATMLWLQRQSRRIVQEGLRTEQAVRALALEDPLTGLPNRRLLEESAPLLLNRARRQQQPVALMMVDLDGFKQVNDTHGHAAGDLLLRTVADRMRATLRDGDLLARLGGDEFVVLLDGSAKANEVLRVSERLVDAVNQPLTLPDGAEAQVSASIGLACFPADGERLERLLSAADEALYAAKRAGKNRLSRAGRDPVTHVLAPRPPRLAP